MESESRSSCRVLDLDVGDPPFEQQAPIALCDDHILRRPLQDPRLNRSSPRIARIQNAVIPLHTDGCLVPAHARGIWICAFAV